MRRMGRVHSPSGAKSIVHDSEVVPAGYRFAFELRVPRERLTEDQIAQVCACMQVVGLGSARSMERGKFRVDQLTITDAKPKPKAKAEKLLDKAAKLDVT